MLLAVLIVTASNQISPVPLRLRQVEVDLPTPDQAVLVLEGEGCEPTRIPALKQQRLRIGDVTVPVSSGIDARVVSSGSRVSVTIPLGGVGDGILSIDPYAVPVRWEGFDLKGRPALALAGAVNLADRAQVSLPIEKLYRGFARLVDYSVSPAGTRVEVKALVSLYNPFAFEVVVTGMEYRLAVGGEPVIASRRAGLRLRAGRHSDVLVEETVPLVDLAGGLTAFLAHKPATFTGVIGIRTPRGDRRIPLLLQAGR
ncbi:MAG TPA: LEA type 2 family protein [Thermoanaerobaculaceae bacterium]|nr:LEA type 2 family protein [Thermoanaerobaculaceae bacterium]